MVHLNCISNAFRMHLNSKCISNAFKIFLFFGEKKMAMCVPFKLHYKCIWILPMLSIKSIQIAFKHNSNHISSFESPSNRIPEFLRLSFSICKQPFFDEIKTCGTFTKEKRERVPLSPVLSIYHAHFHQHNLM